MHENYINMWLIYVNICNMIMVDIKLNPLYCMFTWLSSYGDILLPPTCKINYVNMQHNYVNMRLIYVDMQHNYVDMHVINFCKILFFSMCKFSFSRHYLTLHMRLIYVNMQHNYVHICDLFMSTCANIIMSTCDLVMSTCSIITVSYTHLTLPTICSV